MNKVYLVIINIRGRKSFVLRAFDSEDNAEIYNEILSKKLENHESHATILFPEIESYSYVKGVDIQHGFIEPGEYERDFYCVDNQLGEYDWEDEEIDSPDD